MQLDNKENLTITIVGCGVMGNGIASLLSPLHTVFLYDRTYEKAELAQNAGKGIACRTLDDALLTSDALILAVKPQNLDQVQIGGKHLPEQLLISLLSGTPISRLHAKFTTHQIVRIMPNLPMIYGDGLIGAAVDKPLPAKAQSQLLQISTPLGKIYWLDEAKMNAFTSLAGSGPAFIYTMIESMIEAGISMGFNAKESQKIVQEMVYGSLQLLEKSNKHPAEIKWQIASPRGTTIAGLKKLEEFNVRAGIMHTFLAAFERANEVEKVV